MKTALDALMEALETDTWTPPVGAEMSPPEPFSSFPTESASATIRGMAWNKLRPVVEQAIQQHKTVNSIALCRSPHCAGCYEVEPGVRIHPPKCSENYRAWLERWEAKGRVQ